MLTRSLFHPHSSARSYTTAIAGVVKLFQAKGVYVPFASSLLSKSEYQRYSFYRAVKECDTVTVKNALETHPLTLDHKENLVSYIDDLESQPYSVPNLLIAYWSLRLSEFSSRFFLSSFSYTPPSWMKGHLDQPPVSDISPFLAYPSFIPMAYFGYIGFSLINAEFRAPYRDYESLARVVKGWTLDDDKITDEIK